MKIILGIVIILVLTIFGLYQITKSKLADCFVSAQEAMAAQLDQGTMTDLHTSCTIGQNILGKSISCMRTVRSSGITQVLAPVVQNFNPKLTPEYLGNLQNTACTQYPETHL